MALPKPNPHCIWHNIIYDRTMQSTTVCIKVGCPSQCLPTSTKPLSACCISNFLIHVSCRSSLAQTARLASIGFADSGPGFCAYFYCQDCAGERHLPSSFSVKLSSIIHHFLGAVTTSVVKSVMAHVHCLITEA